MKVNGKSANSHVGPCVHLCLRSKNVKLDDEVRCLELPVATVPSPSFRVWVSFAELLRAGCEGCNGIAQES